MDLYDLWFTKPSLWFNASIEDNKYLASRFSDWINQYQHCYPSIRNYISCIILYDQIPRNLNIQSNYYDNIALQYVLKLQSISNNYELLNAKEWCFAMLPYRHTNNIYNIHSVIDNAWKRIRNTEISSEDKELYKKFIKASYERCPTYCQNLINTYNYSIFENNEWDFKQHINILEYSTHFKINLEYDKRYIDNITKSFENILNKLKSNEFILSLSGGVDSMISSVILKRLEIKYKFRFVAVHINYNNRTTCNDEVEMLKKWCNFLNIVLYVRNINEINRPLCMEYLLREIYETYTRNVRYDVYKSIWYDKLNNPSNTSPIVFLGHNQDDKCENILTNIAQQSKYNSLNGMDYIQTVDNIKFIRPMLDITKDEIYTFSRKYGIPHLPNSTPSWSMRGKIRDIVKPSLQQWHPNIINGLMNLSNIVTDLYDILQIQVNTAINNTIKIDDKTYVYEINYNEIYKLCSKSIFWQDYINKLCNIHISLKSSLTLQYKIENWKNKNIYSDMKIPLHKNINILFKTFTNENKLKIYLFII